MQPEGNREGVEGFNKEKDGIRSLVDKATPAALWAGGLGGDPELIRLEARKGIREMLQGSGVANDGGLS